MLRNTMQLLLEDHAKARLALCWLALFSPGEGLCKPHLWLPQPNAYLQKGCAD